MHVESRRGVMAWCALDSARAAETLNGSSANFALPPFRVLPICLGFDVNHIARQGVRCFARGAHTDAPNVGK